MIRPFEIGGDVVLDFNLVKATELTEAAHARRHSEQPLQHVEIVQALIEQYSAAFAFPSRAPRTAGVISLAPKPIRVDPVHAGDFAEVAVADQRADFFVTRFDAQLKHAAEHELGIFQMRGDELFRVGFVSGDRLLDHQVQSRLERRDAERRVLIMRRGDDDRVHRLRADEFHRIAKHLHAFRRVVGEFVGRCAANGGEMTVRDLPFEQISSVMLTDVAHADDADADVIHVIHVASLVREQRLHRNFLQGAMRFGGCLENCSGA